MTPMEVDSVDKALLIARRHGLLVKEELLNQLLDSLCEQRGEDAGQLAKMGLTNPDSAPQALGWVAARGHFDVTSTKAGILSRLIYRDEALAALLRYRSVTAQLRVAAAVYASLKMPGRGDRVVHCDWSFAVTGRIYTKGPNLQCSPECVRRAIYARPQHAFIMVDWSAAELFALAALAGDAELCVHIGAGGDVHQFTADTLAVDRKIGKLVNLGLLYGMTGRGMEEYTGLPADECNNYIETWLDKRPLIRDLRLSTVKAAREQKGIRAAGHFIAIPAEEWEKDPDKAARHAVCYLGQGTVAWLMRGVLGRSVVTRPWLRLPLHDGALYEVPVGCLHQMVDVAGRLEEAWSVSLNGYHFRVNLKAGDTWHAASPNGDAVQS